VYRVFLCQTLLKLSCKVNECKPLPGPLSTEPPRPGQRTCGWWLNVNSVPGLVSRLWYRSLFDQSEPSKAKIPPAATPESRPGTDSWSK